MDKQNFTPQELEKLKAMLLSPDEQNAQIALEIIKSNGLPTDLERAIALLLFLEPDHFSKKTNNHIKQLFKTFPTKKQEQYQKELSLLNFFDNYAFETYSNYKNIRHQRFLREINLLEEHYGDYFSQRSHLHQNLAWIADSLKDEEGQLAERLYKLLIKWRTDHERVYFQQAIIEEYDNKNVNAAINCYKSLLNINPKHHTAHGNIGLMYQSLEDIEKAVDHFKSSLKIKPQYTFSLNNLAYLYWKKMDKYDEASKLYEEVLKLNPNYHYALANYAALLIEHYEGHLERAEKMLRKAIKVDNKFDYPWKILGRLMMAKSPPDKASALEAYEKAHLYDPEDEETLAELNQVKEELRNE